MFTSIKNSRFKLLYTLFLIFLAINFLTRAFLFALEFNSVDLAFLTIVKTFAVGFFYDIVAGFYYFIFLAIYLFIIPTKIYNLKIHKLFLYLLAGLMVFLMLFNSVSEYFFWEEFGKRFNFIAVDYLVYTHEVLHNIEESYPLPLILGSIFAISLIVVFALRDWIFVDSDKTSYLSRAKITVPFLLVSLINFNILDKQPLSKISQNIYNNELAKDGLYSLFSAFRHNELDYYEYYKTLPNSKVFSNLKKLEKFDNNSSKEFSSTNPLAKKNIILIMVESLSAEYMGAFGSKRGWTPNLDKLTKESLFFNNLYATGTRTVRGMEAVTLSVPPTPGRSIVKRPLNDNLDSIGDIFKKYGYENKFIYAGHGYFDNMNNFFSKNGFEIVDRLNFEDSEITFANVWGVCDEDLLNKTLKEADKSYKDKKPFFNYVMTTSNHRPYTYPDGKIDIPSHSGRSGGVKYTDYAIDNFLKQAKSKPWFKDTIFVIVADHNGGSAGKSSLPLYRYKIPLIIYAPDFIKPQVVSKLASQIDTMPTIFNLLGFNYKAKFYGNNILDEHFKQRAFIGNYQKLGYVKNGYVYYLTPDKKAHKQKIVKLKLTSVKYKQEDIKKDELEEIVTYYQSASYIYKHSKSKKRK
jgi:phosphoglycerol transferase MdoB-like AlkP superfamily enzyme